MSTAPKLQPEYRDAALAKAAPREDEARGYDPQCPDCMDIGYACADHDVNPRCTNCGFDGEFPGELHHEKKDRQGKPIRVWWCRKCNDDPNETPRPDYEQAPGRGEA